MTTLFDDDGVPTPQARWTDPETSHIAAASVSRLTEKRAAVLLLLREIGPATDEELVATYSGPPQKDSGIRTRRSELVKLGLVRPTGERVRNRTGGLSQTWEVAS